MTRDNAGRPGNVFLGFGERPHHRRLYFETYIRLDPVEAMLPGLSAGQVVSDSSVTPPAEFLRTRFYQEWMEPQGWLDRVFLVVDRSPAQIILVVVSRSQADGWADEGVNQRLRLIAPHLRRSVLACQAVSLETLRATTLTDTLNCLSVGAFLIDANGQIVHMNSRGSDMLSQDPLQADVTGPVSLHRAEARQALLQRLARAAQGASGRGKEGSAIAIKSPKCHHYVAHLLPLAPGTSGQVDRHGVAAAVFFQNASPAGPDLATVIQRHYELTPAETRVLLTIIHVGSIQEAASALGITKTTVKTHLRRVFAKTQASGQIELVKLIAGFSPVFSR